MLFVAIDELVRDADSLGVEMDVVVDEDDDMTSIWLASIVIIEGAIEPPNRRLEEYYTLHGFDIERHGHRTIITRTP